MRAWRRSARSVWGAALLLLCCPAALSAASCDEFSPAAPARSTQITLDASDFVDESRDEMRSFVETGSLGRVEARVVSATPAGVVRGLSAVPRELTFRPGRDEALKGVALSVSLRDRPAAATIVVDLRQVCAQYFRNTFLYY